MNVSLPECQAAYVEGLSDARQAAEAQAAEELRAAWLDGFRLGLKEAYGPAFHDGYRAARAAGVSNGNIQATSRQPTSPSSSA